MVFEERFTSPVRVDVCGGLPRGAPIVLNCDEDRESLVLGRQILKVVVVSVKAFQVEDHLVVSYCVRIDSRLVQPASTYQSVGDCELIEARGTPKVAGQGIVLLSTDDSVDHSIDFWWVSGVDVERHLFVRQGILAMLMTETGLAGEGIDVVIVWHTLCRINRTLRTVMKYLQLSFAETTALSFFVAV